MSRRPYSPLQRLRHPVPAFDPVDDLEMESPELSLSQIGTGGRRYEPSEPARPLDWEAFGGGQLPEYQPAPPDPEDAAMDAELFGGWNEPRPSGLRGLREPSAPPASPVGTRPPPAPAPEPHPADEEFTPAGQPPPNPALPVWKDANGQPQGTTGTGQAESALGSFGRGVERNIGSAVGGTIGGIAGSVGAGLALAAIVSNPVGWVAGLVGLAGGLAGALGGMKLGQATQDALLGEEETRRRNEQYAIDQAQHPYATFAGAALPHLAGGAAESAVVKGIGTLRAANAASRSRLLRAGAKPNAAALEAMEGLAKAQQDVRLAESAVRSAKTPLARETATAQLKTARAALKGLVDTARENGAVAMTPAGQAAFRKTVNSTYLTLEAGATLGWPGDAPYNFNAPEYITPAQELGLDVQNLGERLLSEEEVEKVAEARGSKVFWNSVWQNLSEGGGAIGYLPVFGSLHNARYQHDLERRRARLVEPWNPQTGYGPGYETNPEYLADLRRVTADENLRAIEAKREHTIRGLAADIAMQSLPFMLEIGVAPDFIAARAERGAAARAAASLGNMLAKAPFNVAGTLNRQEQLKANTWSITPGEWDALNVAVARRGDDELTALWKAWADNGIEYLSEGMGEVAQTGLYRLLLKKKAPGRVVRFLREMVDEAPPAGSMRSMLKAGGSQPLFEQYEERAGDIMRILAGIDDHAGDVHEDGTPVGKGERILQAFNPLDQENLRQWGAEFIAFSVPGAAQGVSALRSQRRAEATGAAGLDEVRRRTADHFVRLGMPEKARAAAAADTPEAIRAGYAEAVTATFVKTMRDRAGAELDDAMRQQLDDTLKAAPDIPSVQAEILARFLSSETEMERALAASSALLAGAGEYGEATEQEKEALAQRAVNVLSGMVEEWGNVGGDSAMDRLDAIVADANLRIRNGSLDPSAATWKKADLENLQRAINDRAVHAATSITVRALVDSLSEEDRAQFDRIAFSNQKMEFLDRVLRSKYASLNANFAVARYVLDNGLLDTLPDNMTEALLGAMGRDFASFGYAVDEKASPREKLRQLTEAVREDERNKEFLDLFAKTGGAEAQRIDVAAEGAEADVPAAFEDLAAPAAPEAPAAAPEDDLDMSPPPAPAPAAETPPPPAEGETLHQRGPEDTTLLRDGAVGSSSGSYPGGRRFESDSRNSLQPEAPDVQQGAQVVAETATTTPEPAPAPAPRGPIPLHGNSSKTGEVYLGKGDAGTGTQRIGVSYRVVEAADIAATRSRGEVQERDESVNPALAGQVEQIANRLDFRQVAESPDATMGAPILTKAGVALAGNGRALGIQRAYAEGKAEDYRAKLVQWARENGLGDVSGLKAPVLVRIVVDSGGLTDAQIALLSNRATGAAINNAESAMAVANAILRDDSLFGGSAAHYSGMTLAELLRDERFVRRLQTVTGYQGEAFTPQGRVTPEFEDNVRRAMVIAALTENSDGKDRADLVRRLSNDQSEGIKAAVDAIAETAPSLLAMRKNAAYRDVSILREVGDALAILASIRADGLTVGMWTGQGSLAVGAGNTVDYRNVEPVTRALVEWFGGPDHGDGKSHPSSKEKNAALLKSYIRHVGNRHDALLPGMGADIAIGATAKWDILKQAFRDMDSEAKDGPRAKFGQTIIGHNDGSANQGTLFQKGGRAPDADGLRAPTDAEREVAARVKRLVAPLGVRNVVFGRNPRSRGPSRGSFNTDANDRTIYLEDFSEGTLFHEVAHALWLHATAEAKNHPRMALLLRQMRAIANSAPESLYDIVLKDYAGEKNPDVLLNELFAHYMEVQGGRAWIEAVRERERPWIVRIWNRITAFLESAAGFWLPGMKSKYRDVRTGLRHVAADLAAGREVDIEGLVRAAERGASEDSAIADDAAAMYADGADPVARMPVGQVRRELVKRGMDPVGAPAILRDRLRGKVREEEAARQAEEAARRAEEDRRRREQEERDRAAREEEEKRKKAERDARKAQADAERQRKEQEAAEASRKEEEARQAAEQARANRTPEQQKEAREAEIARTQEAFDAYKQRRLADKDDTGETTPILNASSNLFEYLSRVEELRNGKIAEAADERSKPPVHESGTVITDKNGKTLRASEMARKRRAKKIRTLEQSALDLQHHIDDVREEFGNPDFPTGDLDQAPEPATAAEQPVAAAPAPQPVKEQPETPEAVSENAEPPQKTENPSPAPEAAKPGDEFASRILDAIETDARDGLIAVFSDNRFGDGAYVANYAAGSMEEVQRAADGIRKAFPGMEVLASDTGLVIKPKKASTQALSQASQESQESRESQPKAEQPKEATSDNEKTDMELARSVWRDEALSSWKGEKTDKLREYARKAGIPTGGKKRAQLLEELADKFAEGYLMDADGKPLSDFVALMASTHAIEEQEGPRAYKDEFEAIERELTPEEREEYMRLMRDTIRKPDAQNALEAFKERVGIDGSWDEGYWIKRPSSDGKDGGETKGGTAAQESKAPAAEEKQADEQAIEEGKRLNAEYERTLQARDSQHTEPRSMVDLEWRLAALRALRHEMRHPGTIRPIYARAFGDEYKTPEEVEVAIGHVQRMIEEEAAAQEDISAKSFTEVKAIAKELGIKTGGKNKTRLVWEIQNKQKAAAPATPALPTMEESGIVQAKETGAEEHEPDASKGQVDAERGHPVGTGESDDGTGGREVPGNGPGSRGGHAESGERIRDNAREDDAVAGEGVGENSGGPQGANGDRRSRNAENHVITDPDFLDAGGAKAKFRDNLSALRVLKTLREEGREATPEERETIAKYVGWGRSEFRNGLFAYWGPEWEKERNQLREVLGDEEFESARRSTLTAFWTPPRMAQGVWKALERLGFQGGRIHEPSIGTGIFYGTMPTDIRDRSQLSGADKDVLASEIARHLYPGARITNGAFQEENLPDDFYDLVVGNFPFADITIRRDKYNHVSANLHDYFWLKSLGIVRPGGLVAAITSTGTMDKANDAVRREIAAKADVVAAVRLPEGTFKGVAGTDVVTDLIILRKRGEGEEMSEDTKAWMDTVRYGELDEKWDVLTGFVNKYYQLHPDHLLGTPTASYGQYGRDTTLKPAKDGNVQERLDSILVTLPENLYAPRARKSGAPKAASTLDATGAASKLRDGSLVAQNGEIWEKDGPALNQVKATPPQKRKARMLIGLRDALNLLRQAETEDNPDMERLRKELNRQYDAFVKEYGPLNKKGMLGIMANDPASHMLLALERSYNPDANKAVKADIFTTRVGYAKSRATTAENYEQAAGFSMNETGRLDAERVGEMMGVDTATAERELLKQGLAYRAPDGELVGADEYLSGNVRDKLRQAEAAARLDPEYNSNVDALRKVLPADKKPGDFTASLGSTWIPGDVMSDFSAHVLGLTDGEKGLSFEYSHSLGRWVVSMPPKGYEAQRIETSSAYTTKYATAHRGFLDILDAAMHDQHMRITRRDPYTGETEFLAVETEEANNKAEQLKDAFLAWVWTDDKRAARLARIYNDTFNGFVERKKGGRWLTFPGMAPSIKPRPHQVAAVEKMLASHRLLMAHEVGTGKTITYGLMAEKAKETGIAAKPLLVVKNSTVKQVAAEIQRLFPNMNIFVGGESMTAGRRKRSMAQIANNNWDLVILTHDNLGTLDADPAIERGFIDGQIEELRAAAYAVMSANMSKKDRERIRRNLLKRIESLEERLSGLLKAPKTDGVATFQDLGFDMVMVDECQAFKKLPIATYRSRVKGIPVEGSKRASALLMNVQHLVETNPNACVVFGSGTPLDNSLVEAYVWQRFLQNDLLKAAGIDSFDAWAANFGHTTTDLEMSPSGGDWKEVERFKEFVNLGELSSMMRQNMDVVFADDTGEITRPKRHDQIDNTPPSEVSEEILADLEARAKAILARHGKAKKGDDNMLVVCGDGRKAAVHPGLYKPEYVNAKGTKADACIARVAANHKADPKAAQMIFCDCGVNDTPWGFNLYRYLRDGLVKAGFKPNQVAFFSSNLSPAGRAALADKMNNGEILVAIGSTDTMGTGINAQKRLRWMHHLDASRMMTPGSIEQRNGRGHRQGNDYKDVEVVTYTQERSLDVFTWNLIKNKAGFINAFLRGDNLSTIEEESDIIPAGQISAVASGDPRVFRRAKAEKSLRRLKLQEAAFEQSKKGQMREKSWAERRLAALDAEAKALDTAVEMADRTAGQPFSAQIPKTGLLAASTHTERNSALSSALGAAVESVATDLKGKIDDSGRFERGTVAKYRGFDIQVQWERATSGDKQLRYLLAIPGESGIAYYLSPNFDLNDKKNQMLAVFRSADGVIGQLKHRRQNTIEERATTARRIEELSADLDRQFDGAEKITSLEIELRQLNDALSGKDKEKKKREGEVADAPAPAPEAGGTTLHSRTGVGTHARDWTAAKIPEIRRELVRRGLSPSGSAAALRRRLEEDDRERNGGVTLYSRGVEETSSRFDKELQQQIAGTLPSGHIYQLGRPGAILRSTGIPDLPIQLTAARLAQKSSDQDHPFDIREVRGIVKSLQEPVAVFAYGDKAKAQNLIVEISSNGKNFLVGISLNPQVGGRVLNVNSIRNVFPKDTSEWLHWIEQGKLLYADKQKIQDLINQQRINLADVAYLDLDRVHTILDSFENPQADNSDRGTTLHSRSGVSSSDVDRWFDAQVVERRRGSRRFYDIKSGDDLIGQGYRSREAALFVIERERSLLDLAKEALAKSGLGRDRLANISEARRRFVERMKDSAASNETRAEAFEEFAKSIGLHKDVLEAEWKHAKAILTADSPAQADMRAAIANRAATTVLARASIRAVARDMDKFFKEKLDKDLPAGGLRRNVLTNVADARAAMDRKTSPEDIRRQVADTEDRVAALEKMLDTNEDSSGNELTKEEREKVSREYAEKVMQLRILRAFEGLKHNHPGKTAASLLQDLDAWNNAKMELEAITRKSIEDIDRIEAERSEQATMDRAIILDEMTGGVPVPTRNEQRTLNAQHPLRRKAADTARGWFAAILGGGRAWGEFMTGKKSVGYGQSHASKLLHEGLASAQNREMRMKEEDDEHFVEIINRFAKRPLDPKRSLKDMNDYSEYCSGLYLERKENDIRFRKVSYGTEKNPDTGKEERVAIITPGEHCHLSKGELMHIWLIGLQAQDAAGQEYTDLPKKKKGCDTSLMESMLAIGYSARTMDEIRAVLVRENLDQMALAISEDMERKSDPLDDLMERIFHSRLKRIKHYCPLRRTHYGLLEKGDKGANGTGQFMSLVRSFLKERVANHRDIEPMNLIDAWQSHNRQANHIISHADWISRIARIFRNQQIQGAIDWTAGSEAREMFNSWLDIQARGGSVPVSNGLIERLGRTFSRVMTTSLRVAAKQTTSATMALSVLPKGASLTRWWADLAAVTFNPALQTKFRRMLVDESPEWRQRGFYADDMQAMAARGAASRTAPGRLWNIYKTKVGRVLGKMTSFGDKTGAVMGCYGIYKAWERKLKKEGGHSPEETHRLALEKFVEAMNTTQQSAVAEYMSHVQTQGGLMRMMYMFHTAQASMTRNYMLHLRALMQGRGSRGEHIRALAGITFAQFLFLEAAHFFVPMASAMFGAPPDPDDEDEKAAWTVAKDIITAVGTAPMGGLYITGDLIAKGLEATLDWQGKKHGLQKRGPQPLNLANELLPALDPLNDVLPLLKNAPKQIAEFDTLSPDVKERYYRQAADAYGAASGSALPKFLVEFGLGMKDAWTADDLTLLQRAARGLSFSRSAIGAPKRKPAPPPTP